MSTSFQWNYFAVANICDVVIGRSSDVETSEVFNTNSEVFNTNSEVFNTNSEVFAKLFKLLTKMVKFCRARLVMFRTVYYTQT